MSMGEQIPIQGQHAETIFEQCRALREPTLEPGPSNQLPLNPFSVEGRLKSAPPTLSVARPQGWGMFSWPDF